MTADSENAIKWALSPSDDQNFDSVSMRHSTIVDSEYAAERIWLHEMQHEHALNCHRLPPTGPVIIQIQMMTNATSSASDTQPTQEVVTATTCTQTIKKKIISWKVKIFYGILAISILTVAVAAVFSMLQDNGKKEMPTLGMPAMAPDLAPTLLGGMFYLASALYFIRQLQYSILPTHRTKFSPTRI